MKHFFTIIFALVTLIGTAQTVSDFENFGIGLDSALNGSDGNGGFQDGHAFFQNNYIAAWNSWNGWAISSTRDTTTAGYTNGFSAITGGGYNGSATYAVAFASPKSMIKLTDDAAGKMVQGFYITNATYAYLSMLNGDSFAKKFGGVTGDDPDYLLLTIKKYQNGVLSTDSIDFYMADYRFADNTEDYIIKDWTYVDMTSLGDADSLVFTMTSTDVGSAGMNTPAYFCIDNFTTADFSVNTTNIAPLNFKIFPNPTVDYITVEGLGNSKSTYQVYDMNGRLVQNGLLLTTRINLSALPKGMYSIAIFEENKMGSQLIIKE